MFVIFPEQKKLVNIFQLKSVEPGKTSAEGGQPTIDVRFTDLNGITMNGTVEDFAQTLRDFGYQVDTIPSNYTPATDFKVTKPTP